MSLHTGATRRGKTRAGQFLPGPRDGAAEVVQRICMTAGKARAAALHNGGHGGGRQALAQQFLGDPFVGDAPVGLGNRCGMRNRCSQAWYSWPVAETAERSVHTSAGPVSAAVTGRTACRAFRSKAAPWLAQPGAACWSCTQGA